MSPNTEKRCRSSDRVILLGILPINTTRRSSCGQGCPIHEQDPSRTEHPPCMASHHSVPWPEPPSNAAGKAAPPWLSEVTEGLWIPSLRFPALHHSLLHVPSGGSSAFGSGPVHHNCICQGRNEIHELQNHGGARRVIPSTRLGDGLGRAHTPVGWSCSPSPPVTPPAG